MERGRADQRVADVYACLFGEPLAGEKASTRMLRIDLGRPHPRMVIRGRRYELEDKSQRRWPEDCAGPAEDASASRLLSAREREALTQLAVTLRDDTSDIVNQGAAADALVQRPLPPSSFAKPPWKLVALLPPHPSLPCDRHTFVARSETIAIVGGKPGCAVTSSPAARFDAVRERGPADSGFAWKPACRATAKDTGNRREIHVSFGDASEDAQLVVTSRFEETDHRRLNASDLTVSCRSSEARVSWAWGVLIDQAPAEEIVLATCVPGHCEVRTSLAHVETTRSSGCGYCMPDPDHFELIAPKVIALPDVTVLSWNTSSSARVRVGAFDRLDDATETVLWFEADRSEGAFDRADVLMADDVVLISEERAGKVPPRTRVFRVDRGGPRELTMP